MKGVIFTEFLDMVEQVFSADMVDDLIGATNPPSQGAYTAVGTYAHEEIVAMVVELSQRSGMPVPDLLEAFGTHLFARFSRLYPTLMPAATSSLDFLETIEAIIHVQVLKLYPDAQLPRLEGVRHSDTHLTLEYRSPRGMQDLAVGLIKGCGNHFGESLDIVSTEAYGGFDFEIRRV
ncbi:MAG: heme NO-binding domain-containing protein [Salinibacterium sp.]|nr:heme NO-binding domain-containing protein [Salinibacterium sp.]